MAITKENTIMSFDVEATGDTPMTSSCNMMGFALCRDMKVDENTPLDDWVIGTKLFCMKEIRGRPMDKRCKKDFWANNKDVLKYIRENEINPEIAVLEFKQWYEALLEKYDCRWVARPTSFDAMWIRCLFDEFSPMCEKIDPSTNKVVLDPITGLPIMVKKSVPVPFSMLCVSTMGSMAKMCGLSDEEFNKLVKHPTLGMSHMADDDALYQAYMFLRLKYWIKENLVMKPMTIL